MESGAQSEESSGEVARGDQGRAGARTGWGAVFGPVRKPSQVDEDLLASLHKESRSCFCRQSQCATLPAWIMTTPHLALPRPAGWLEAMNESDAQLATGQTVPLEPLLDELRHTAEQLEAKLAEQPNHTAAIHEP